MRETFGDHVQQRVSARLKVTGLKKTWLSFEYKLKCNSFWTRYKACQRLATNSIL